MKYEVVLTKEVEPDRTKAAIEIEAENVVLSGTDPYFNFFKSNPGAVNTTIAAIPFKNVLYICPVVSV